MLKLFALLIGVVHAQTVDLNKYLVFPTIASAQARSIQQCQALHCDGIFTKYWWNVVPLTDGSAAVQIIPTGTSFGATTNIVVGPCAIGCGLTPLEQSLLKTAAQLGSLLP